MKTEKDKVTIKIPMSVEGLKAVRALSDREVKTNVTLVFSPNQALLAAQAGATILSPLCRPAGSSSTE